MKTLLKKGDKVKVIAGNDKGKVGTLESFSKDRSKVIVEGVNVKTKHIKPSAQNPSGSIEKKEAFIDISNVSFTNDEGKSTLKLGKKLNEKGKLQRFVKSKGDFI